MKPSLLLWRAGVAALTLMIASLIVFFSLNLIPGDPALSLLGVGASPEAVARLREGLGLNLPPLSRYLGWLGGALRGDLGESIRYSQPVSELLRGRLPFTLALTLGSLLLSTALALALGVLAARRAGSRLDLALRVVLTLLSAIPAFWLGLILILIFAVRYGLLASTGFSHPRDLILPVATLVLVRVSLPTRMVRSSLLAVFSSDHVRTARAKGLSERRVLLRHGLRNALIPLLTVLGLEFAELLTGTVIVENVFALPGLGTLALQAIAARDFPLVQGVVLLLAGFVVLVNLLVDLGYGLLDPRVRYG
ncbi:MAG: ABC transporter permease [Deinococcus sp.]